MRDWAALAAPRPGRKGWLCWRKFKDLSVGVIEKLGVRIALPMILGWPLAHLRPVPYPFTSPVPTIGHRIWEEGTVVWAT